MNRYAALTVTLKVPIHETEEEDEVEAILRLAGSDFIHNVASDFVNHSEVSGAATVELFNADD